MTSSNVDDEAAVCRVCRTGGDEQGSSPLFYPCRCRGSIRLRRVFVDVVRSWLTDLHYKHCRYIHESCCLEWLRHTNKTRCELCNTDFKFTPGIVFKRSVCSVELTHALCQSTLQTRQRDCRHCSFALHCCRARARYCGALWLLASRCSGAIESAHSCVLSLDRRRAHTRCVALRAGAQLAPSAAVDCICALSTLCWRVRRQRARVRQLV